MRELIIYPNDILRAKCEDLKQKPSEALLSDMRRIVKQKGGIGLAAPQVGEKINLFILNTDTCGFVFVNPVITYFSKKECSFKEGCLSIPGEQIEIIRPEIIEISYRDMNFIKRKATFSGIDARVCLHEIDHLIGRIILDYAE